MFKSHLFRFILISISILFLSLSVLPVQTYAKKSTTDPTHQGWYKRGKKIKTVEWKDIPSFCLQCSFEVKDYNLAMKEVMKQRHEIASRSNQLNLMQKKIKKKIKKRKATDDDIDKMNTLQELYSELDLMLKKNLIELELTAEQIRREVVKCEKKICKRKKRRKTKFKEGVWPGDSERPLPSIQGWDLSFPWEGPYITECYPCEILSQRLNELPTVYREHSLEIVRKKLDIKEAQLISKILELTDPSNQTQHQAELDANQKWVEDQGKDLKTLETYFTRTNKSYEDCVKDYCGDRGSMCPVRPAGTEINVGPKSAVGISAYRKMRLQRTLMGFVPKLGFGGDDEEPKTKRDWVKRSHKVTIKDKPRKTYLTVGGRIIDDGLLISTKVKKSKGDGTFQLIYLENPRGCRIYPIYYWIFSYWAESTLSIGWSSERYSRNKKSKNKRRSFKEAGRDYPGTAEFMDDRSEGKMAIWEQMGFSLACNGVRALGSIFPVDEDMLKREPLTLVVHVTRPKEDPVTTVPFVMKLSIHKNKIQLERIAKSLAEENEK